MSKRSGAVATACILHHATGERVLVLLGHQEGRSVILVNLHELFAGVGHWVSTLSPNLQEPVEAMQLIILLNHVLHVLTQGLRRLSNLFLDLSGQFA